jgi:hypothetical protein
MKTPQEQKEYQASYYARNKARLKERRAEYYKQNKAHLNAQTKAYYEGHKEVLIKNSTEKARNKRATDVEFAERCRGYWKKARAIAPKYWKTEKGRDTRLNRQRSQRLEAITRYGGKCACCGEDRYEFLALDHVNNDGAAHRKEIRRASIYTWLKRNNYPQDGRFQLLCHNCNLAKAFYGQCPHVAERSQALKVA